MKNKIQVFATQKKYQRHASKAAHTADACLLILGKKDVQIEICLVEDKKIQELNNKFRKKNKPTNVLSFKEPKNFPNPEKKSLGEIYLAPDYIQKEGSNISDLTIHGILHLLGYTHKGVHDKIKMEKKEKSILKKLQNAD